jgi:23S rRNA pseudouridine2605 synthase
MKNKGRERSAGGRKRTDRPAERLSGISRKGEKGSSKKTFSKKEGSAKREEQRGPKRTSSGSARPFPQKDGAKRGGRPMTRRKSDGRTRPGSTRPFKRQDELMADVNGDTRLNKFIANTGVCSRREADELITAGVITVNGKVVTELGTKVKPGDEVRYNNETLVTEKTVYVLLNKPKDYITTVDDPQERRTVLHLVSKACKERIYPVGRLDRNTTGLLLLTNDGELTKRLTHPSYRVKKLYSVELDRNLTKEDMKSIIEGVMLDDGVVEVDQVAWEDKENRSRVGIEIHSGRNRVIRRLFESLGYKVKKLDRVVFAGLTKKDLPRGRYRHLTPMEVNMLKMMTGKKKGSA